MTKPAETVKMKGRSNGNALGAEHPSGAEHNGGGKLSL